MRFWLSWQEPTDSNNDYRPISFPVNERIKHWWCSGTGDNYATLCAVVDVKEDEDEGDARDAVLQTWTWDGEEWRFIEKVADDWMPNAGRFPVE